MQRWSGQREATAVGAACVQPQNKTPTSVYSPAQPLPVSEDCLTLNIWVPKNAKNAPVFFWIHGGALVTGASREPMYDGKWLAERGVIVVSINYRLGVRGWLAHPQLTAESPLHVSGNYGLLDQIAALQWVRYNIAAFGGDAKNVTIAGESAGALSVMYLMDSPLAPGLQAPDLAALRGMDAQTITDSAAKMGYGPWGTVDGLVLPMQMVDAFDQGKQAPVPLLAGFNQGEIRSLMMLAPKPPATAADYEAAIRARHGELADAFLRLYPASDYKESIIATTRDALYGWTAERLARKQTAIGQPAYLYLIDHGYPAMDAAGLHAVHASELPFVFGTIDTLPPRWPAIPATADERALSDAMADYWTSFARTGKPVASNAPAWPAYGAAGNYMHFAATPQPDTKLMPGMYALNETVMCRKNASGVAWNWNVGLNAPKLPAL